MIPAGWWRSGGTEKRDYVLVEAEGMDGGATAVELYLGGDELDAGEGDGMISFPVAPVRPGAFSCPLTSPWLERLYL